MKKQKTVANIPGADPTLPGVSLELQGKTYQLVFDFNAICSYEHETGDNILLVFESEKLTSVKLRALLWAALQKKDPELTIQHVGSLFGLQDIARVSDAVVRAIMASKPEPSPDPNA